MCGITGIFGNEPSREDLDAMMEVAKRRGPEGSRTLSTNQGLVGHTQLGFVRVGDNPQPLQEGDSWIIYNGEVYNWTQLNQTYNFNAKTDTEVLLRGLNKKGVDFLKEIDGQFAFVANINNTVMLGRDKYGISPLVFGKNEKGQIAIASTTEALAQAQVKEAKTVPAGAYGTITDKVNLDYWFELPQVPVEDQKKIPASEIRNESLESVIARIPDDRTTAYTTMGGIDSQFITATVARHTSGKFGGAITVVPWDPKDPTNTTLGDYHAARSAVEMLQNEGIQMSHFVVQLTPEYVATAIDRVLRVLGPDFFNISCGLAEDLVASTARSKGGKTVLTAGGPDEAGRSYKPWTLLHKSDLEAGFHAVCDQFSSAEGVRAGLVFGEHGIENRVPLAFLIEKMAYATADQKQVIHDWGDGSNPFSIKMDDKVLWREAIKGLVSDYALSRPKETIHGATGAKEAVYHIAQNDQQYQAARAGFLETAKSLGWDKMCSCYGPIVPGNKIAEGQLYCLYRWSKLEQAAFETGAAKRFPTARYSPKLEDKIAKPICYDWLPR